jgi:hypothetical protein
VPVERLETAVCSVSQWVLWICAARFIHLTTRAQNKLSVIQAQAVIAAAILRQLHAVITTGRAWDPAIAAHGTTRLTGRRCLSPPEISRRPGKHGRG